MSASGDTLLQNERQRQGGVLRHKNNGLDSQPKPHAENRVAGGANRLARNDFFGLYLKAGTYRAEAEGASTLKIIFLSIGIWKILDALSSYTRDVGRFRRCVCELNSVLSQRMGIDDHIGSRESVCCPADCRADGVGFTARINGL